MGISGSEKARRTILVNIAETLEAQAVAQLQFVPRKRGNAAGPGRFVVWADRKERSLLGTTEFATLNISCVNMYSQEVAAGRSVVKNRSAAESRKLLDIKRLVDVRQVREHRGSIGRFQTRHSLCLNPVPEFEAKAERKTELKGTSRKIEQSDEREGKLRCLFRSGGSRHQTEIPEPNEDLAHLTYGLNGTTPPPGTGGFSKR